jgi:hypothetical protein
MDTKDCKKCGFEQELTEFPTAPGNHDGRGNTCKLCIKSKRLMDLYGITIEDWNEMYDAQGGKCAICGAFGTRDKGLYVDHSHKTNKVRALLCQNCNALIGHAFELPERLLAAISYLQQHNVT